MRQVSAIFWRSDQGGSVRWRSIWSVVRAWYSAFSRMITSVMARRLLSLGLHAGLAHQRCPFRDLGRHISGQLGWAVSDHPRAPLPEPVADPPPPHAPPPTLPPPP